MKRIIIITILLVGFATQSSLKAAEQQLIGYDINEKEIYGYTSKPGSPSTSVAHPNPMIGSKQIIGYDINGKDVYGYSSKNYAYMANIDQRFHL